MTTTQLANALIAHALTLPEAWEDHPWGETAIKVRKKAFLFSGLSEDEVFTCSMKLKETSAEVLQRENATPTGYGLGKHGWVSFRFEPGDDFDLDEVKEWLEESYRSVAPKTLARQLL